MKDNRVDLYIANVPEFAKPILKHLRNLVHKACPDVKETIKWGMPAFDYYGILCSMASFKQHTVFGFWKGSLLTDPKNYLQKRSAKGGEAMGNFGRITTLKDLPSDTILIDFIKQAKILNIEGVKMPVKQKKTKELIIAKELAIALEEYKKAKSYFEKLSLSQKRDYCDWINEAKSETTKTKRINTTIEWLSEGKTRNWKYENKSKK
jgi:uncharacterized protein YdeI (YjbR/CyaY-like superfamily)